MNIEIRAKCGFDPDTGKWHVAEVMTDGEWEAGGEWDGAVDDCFVDFREVWITVDVDTLQRVIGQRKTEGGIKEAKDG